MSILNNIVNELDIALRTLADKKTGTDRKYPPEPIEKNSEELSKKEKDLSIQMMRINHAGEVAAQALYRGQAFVCKDPEIKKHLKDKLDNNFFKIIHTENLVKSTDSPLEAAKRGKDTSMWLAIDSVKKKESDIVISAGNKGELLVIAKLNLKMIENIDKPALSALWPNEKGMSVVLDLGANIECSDKNLIDFAVMGSSVFKSLYPNEIAKVALLNIGSEEMKGNEVIKETYQKLNRIKSSDYEFKGYIEGNNLMKGDVNVIVSDGFTGNIALKTAEGTANFITKELKKTFTNNIIGKLSGLINYFNFKTQDWCANATNFLFLIIRF